MQADELHPIAAGAELRAQLIAQGVLGCLARAPASGLRLAPGCPCSTPSPSICRRRTRSERRKGAIVAEIADEVARAALGADLVLSPAAVYDCPAT